MVDQNSTLIVEGEKEINHIVQSITDLNKIFRDLAGMVVEQVSRKQKSPSSGSHLLTMGPCSVNFGFHFSFQKIIGH